MKYEVEKPFKVDDVKALTLKMKTTHPKGFVSKILENYFGKR